MRRNNHLVARAWHAGLAALVLAAGCERREHAGEAAIVRRLRVDTTAPPPGNVQLMRAQGESVFYGLLAKGTCSQCHDGQREPGDRTPDLRHSAWLRQASFPSIIHYITHGRRDPREDTPGSSHPGSDSLSGEHIRAVAAYLEAVSRKEESSSSP
jgi:mono/diheme cytochrome c family protein